MSELIVDLGKHEFIHLVRPVQNMNWNTLSKLVEKEDWIIQQKHDGIHALYISGRGLTRDGNNYFDNKFPELIPYLKQLPDNTIIEGEIVCKCQDQEICNMASSRLKQNNPKKKDLESEFIVFDILFCNGENVQNMNYKDRLELLNKLFSEIAINKFLRIINQENKIMSKDECGQQGVEGYIARKNGRYSDECLKFKAWDESDFIVTGYEATATKDIGVLNIETLDGIKSGNVTYNNKFGDPKLQSTKDMLENRPIAIVRSLPSWIIYNQKPKKADNLRFPVLVDLRIGET